MSAPRSLDHFLGVSYFVHPLPLLTVGVLWLNDHWLKRAHPSWLTGKLSDFAGLFFFPLFLCALVNLARNLTHRGPPFHWLGPRLLIVAIVFTDGLFSAVKLYPPATAFYLTSLGTLGFSGARVVRDPSDLLALTSSLAVYAFARPFWREAAPARLPPSTAG